MAQVIESAVLDNLDGVDEAYHGMFTERDGKFEFDGVGGMKTQADITRLQGGLNKERDDHKATKLTLAGFDGIDVATVHTQLDRIAELEAAAGGKLDEDKMNELVETRLVTKIAPINRELGKITKERDSLFEENQGYVAANIKRSIGDSIGKAIAESKGFLQEASEDAIIAGERIFEVNEDGSVTAKDNVGVTPGISPAEWLTDLQPKKPHWWGKSAGGDARPGDHSTPSGNNPWAAETWNVTEQNALFRANQAKAKQLAAAAGSSIGGLKPVTAK